MVYLANSLIWQKTFYETDSQTAQSVQQTSDGGYIVAGATGFFFGGEADFWVLKLDENGSIMWQKTYGGNKSDVAESVHQTSDGGYIVAGITSSFTGSGTDAWILKLDENGNVRKAEVHWYEAHGIGRKKMKIKMLLDE